MLPRTRATTEAGHPTVEDVRRSARVHERADPPDEATHGQIRPVTRVTLPAPARADIGDEPCRTVGSVRGRPAGKRASH
jgi:hypothetical protein